MTRVPSGVKATAAAAGTPAPLAMLRLPDAALSSDGQIIKLWDPALAGLIPVFAARAPATCRSSGEKASAGAAPVVQRVTSRPDIASHNRTVPSESPPDAASRPS